MAASSLIQEGDQVVFRRDGSSRVFQIRKNRQVYFEKSKFTVEELIGQPYGSTFEIDRGKLVKVEAARVRDCLSGEMSAAPEADNRDLRDTETNQKMSKDDIMKMKDEGMTGEKIIEELIENSETFKTKTEFSQAKYLKKKKKKHMLVFTVFRPTARLVMEIFAKEPAKICYLRPDSLSQLLTYSNIMYGSHVGVVETCQGLVLACVLQRMGGQGKLIQLIPNANNAVCRQVMDYFSFPKEDLDNVYSFPMDKLSTLDEQSSDNDSIAADAGSRSTDNKEQHIPNTSNVKADTPADGATQNPDAEKMEAVTDDGGEGATAEAADAGGADDDNDNENDDASWTSNGSEVKEPGDKRPFAPRREEQRRQRAIRQKVAGDIIREKKLDSLILACKYNPTPILIKMLDFLSPSRPVVVYCQFLEPLVECYTQIKEKHVGLQLKLSETWFREYQVLPQRTHPMMNMSGTGGYLLTFMTAAPH